MQVFVGFFCYLTSSFCYRTFEGAPFRTFTRVRDWKGTAAWSGRTNVTEKRKTVGRYKRKPLTRYKSAVLHNPYLGCKHNVKEVPLAWQQLQFFAIYCYLTGSPHDKGN